MSHFGSCVCKSTKQLGFCFTCDAPKIGNELPDNICSAISFLSSRKELKVYFFAKAYPPIDSVVQTPFFMSMDYDFPSLCLSQKY